MAVNRRELPGIFQDTIHSGRLFKRTRAAKPIQPLLAQRIEEKGVLEASPVKDGVVALAPSLKRARVSISKPNANPDNPMNLIVSFEPDLSIRKFEIAWKSVVVDVVRDEQGKLTDDLKINSKIVPKDIEGDPLMDILRSAADVSFTPIWTMPDNPQQFLRERLRVGREKIKKP